MRLVTWALLYVISCLAVADAIVGNWAFLLVDVALAAGLAGCLLVSEESR